MCKYCEKPEPIDNVSNCPTDIYIEKHWWAENDTFFLKIVNEVNMGIAGNHGILTSIKINYCPICGRKLEGTENV